MEKVLSNDEMRKADGYTINELNISSQTLMRRAGLAIAEEVVKCGNGKSILVACGTGNNGGDGYVCAQELLRRGFDVKVYAVAGRLSNDCLREKSEYSGQYSEEIAGDVIVDCLFGTGLCRTVENEYLYIINAINNSGAFVISADIPSGINGDNGVVLGAAVKADVTVAIAEYKRGHFLNEGIDYCGKTVKADIGITCPESRYAEIPNNGDIEKFYPKRKRNTHKGSFGTAQLVAGSDRYTGAAALAAEAALKSGCGYVKLCTTDKVKAALAAKLPQVIYSDEIDFSAESVAIGCGCGVSEKLYGTIKKLLTGYCSTLIIDADGLNTMAKYGCEILHNKNCDVILTPHVKEFSRISRLSVNEILADPITLSQNFAREYNVTVLLKNAVSVLTDGERAVILHRGNSSLAKGGSGDILTGFMCGTVARGVDGFNAAAVASYTLGLSAEISSAEKTEYCVTAKDLIKNLHTSVRKLT